MSWRDNLQQASFRGIPFYVDTSTTGVGRRTEMHVYANTKTGAGKKFQDYVWAKDLGAEPDSFLIEGYVIQNLANNFDYFTERDNLIKALKTQGPGILVHPSFKEPMEVSVDGKASIIEKFPIEGGIARFNMNFVQYNKPIFAQLDTDYVEAVDVSVLDMVNANLDNFTNLMNTAGAFLGSLTAPLLTSIGKVQNAIAATKGAVASTISSAIGTISNVLTLVDSLLTSPCDLIETIKDGVDATLGLVGLAGEIVQGGVVGACSGETRGEVTTMDGTIVPETLGMSIAKNMSDNADYETSDLGNIPDEQSDNLDLATVSTQSLMIGNAIKIAIRIDYSSQENMEYMLEVITDSLDNLINRIGSLGDDVDAPLLYESVSDMRAVFVNSMYAKNTGLTKEIEYEVPSGVMSTLELAYNQYEDIDRCSEIFDRNPDLIKHPGFLPSGEEINILNE